MTPGIDPGTSRIRVWDAPTRLVHWLLVLCFAVAWLTREDDGSLWHLLAGYTLAGLLVFRVLWGFVGSRYALFSDFVRGPGAALRYARGLFGGTLVHTTGHNALGAFGVLVLLGLGLGMGITGWQMAANGGGHDIKEIHELLANLFLAVVGVHIVGVLVSSWRHRENLPRGMVTGFKRGPAGAGIRGTAWPLALLLLVGVAAFWGWSVQSKQLPFGLSATAEMGEAGEHEQGDDRNEEAGEGARGERVDQRSGAAEQSDASGRRRRDGDDD